MLRWFAVATAVAFALSACGGGDDDDSAPGGTATRPVETTPATIVWSIESRAFEERQSIPPLYTCEGDNVSPPLYWGGAPVPERTQSFTLIVDDPDAPGGTFTHWLIYNLPATTFSLPQGVELGEQPPTGGIQGRNDGNRIGYTGPCPPAGQTHLYVFTLYALDTELGPQPGASKGEVEGALIGHVLAQARLTGTFER